ncbi:hypothetical protein FACS1894166_04690 [Bacilli bacterium]|nr:hypothetical protein FACS1894166_04690 [Bacilli bacterium]
MKYNDNVYKLPLEIKLNKEIQELLLETSNNLSELNGLNLIIPNSNIILNALTLTEAKESSAIENILTTYDELFKEMANVGEQNLSVKEVVRYRSSLLYGVHEIKTKNQINLSLVNEVHDLLEPKHKGIREYDGANKTVIKNSKTNEVVYTPPQPRKEILQYLDNLFHYI